MDKGSAAQPLPPAIVCVTVDEAHHLAFQLHRSGSLPEAEMLYRRILDVAPDHLDALHFLAVLCYSAGRNPESLGLIEKIILLAPDNADAHNNHGNVLQSLGRVEEAEEAYRRAITILPSHAPALNNLGVVLASQKRTAEASEMYRRAITLAPKEADFRFNLGNALRKAGETDEAIGIYREVIELDRGHQGAWQALARCLVARGRREEAREAFEEWLRKDPGNEFAGYMWAAMGGDTAPTRAPDDYVCRMFDNLATSFDDHLVNKLDYRAPVLLGEALSAALPAPAGIYAVLDAGCGTGLFAPYLKPYARHLKGVDLSEGMVRIAKTRKVYDDVVIAELTDFLKSSTEAYDIVASSDTLCYFGPLEPVFEAAAKALRSGGVLAFTVEDTGEETVNWRLDPTTRYSHSRSYLEGALEEAGFIILSLSQAVLRTEDRQPVLGHVVVSRKVQAESLRLNRRQGCEEIVCDGRGT